VTFDVARARRYLKAPDLETLFIEEMGWDHYAGGLEVEVDGRRFWLQAVAEKRGVVAFTLSGKLPSHATRRKIDRRVAQSFREHFIVYVNPDRSQQLWQWVRREPGRPLISREHRYHVGQPGDSLLQKLQSIAFSLEEEESLTLVDVTSRVRAAFNVEQATKKFYTEFQKERDAFQEFLAGIPDEDLERWYVSVMLNRLMFIYFIQKKGFLDGDPDYLRNRLARSQAQGADRYYVGFLCPLFFEGFARPARERSPETRALLGEVPFLNGGIFQQHEVERLHEQTIRIPDVAFEWLFDFFERYQWHLDDRPLRADNEINPDVLGYIFEKYINQKQMGAYYTKEDITEYISKNTIIPFLFDEVRKGCPSAFEGLSSVWALLVADPDRYIYDGMRRGTNLDLPAVIAAGIDDVSQRELWNAPTPDDYALPTEIWRETVARRQRCAEVRARLAAGEVQEINDLITYNLDIQQFAQDVIENCETPELLRAFWKAINSVSVLDPTCGSGAFLFAALNILEPLYEGCLTRMEAFLAELAGREHHPHKYKDFRDVLEQVAQHPNRPYFVLKSIVINNLYGVDIMAEAVEIAKLRLFLKLVAQVGRVEDIEPLPDIDFNIRAGNSLVGFATYQEVERAVRREGAQFKMPPFFDDPMQVIEEKARDVDRLYQRFRQQQTELGGEVTPDDKQALRGRLGALADELDRYLAREYGVDVDKPLDFHLWRKSHQPFHWFVEFYGTIKKGGFDLIFGNPPWIEYSLVRKIYAVRGFETEKSGNLYALCTERALNLRSDSGWMSFIVQLPLVSSSRMTATRNLLKRRSGFLVTAPFDDRPSKLFSDLQHCRSVIFLSQGKGGASRNPLYTTQYQRWFAHTRRELFAKLHYVRTSEDVIYPNLFPKYGDELGIAVFEKVKSRSNQSFGIHFGRKETEHCIFYQEAMQYWTKAAVGLPYYAKDGVVGAPAHGRFLYFGDAATAYAAFALLYSSLFYVYFIAYGDGFHLNQRLVESFPGARGMFENASLVELGKKLMNELKANAERKTIRTRDGAEIAYDEYYGGKSKPTIDEIDRVLAQHYGFTDEELDFIVNYDIKYRMGEELFEDRDDNQEDDE
jgi:hypothetical protein